MVAVASMEAIYRAGHVDSVDYLPGADVDAGVVVNLGGGLVGITRVDIDVNSDDFTSADGQDAAAITGQFDVNKAAGGGVTFSRGDLVAWDDTGKTAVPDGDTNDDFSLGVCVKDAADGDDRVLVDINRLVPV